MLPSPMKHTMCPSLATLGSSLMSSVDMEDGRFWLYSSSMGSSLILIKSKTDQLCNIYNKEVCVENYDDSNWGVIW